MSPRTLLNKVVDKIAFEYELKNLYMKFKDRLNKRSFNIFDFYTISKNIPALFSEASKIGAFGKDTRSLTVSEILLRLNPSA